MVCCRSEAPFAQRTVQIEQVLQELPCLSTRSEPERVRDELPQGKERPNREEHDGACLVTLRRKVVDRRYRQCIREDHADDPKEDAEPVVLQLAAIRERCGPIHSSASAGVQHVPRKCLKFREHDGVEENPIQPVGLYLGMLQISCGSLRQLTLIDTKPSRIILRPRYVGPLVVPEAMRLLGCIEFLVPRISV